MKRHIYLILFLLVFACGCRIPEMQSAWTKEEVTIDGWPYEWDKNMFVTLMNKNIGMGVQNDSENLYIIFALRNRMWIDIMQKNGVYLWFDTSNTMKKDFGLRYIGRIHVVEVPREGASKIPAINPPGIRSDFYVSTKDSLIVGKVVKNTEDDTVRYKKDEIMPDGSSGPAANFSMPTRFNPSYMYEFSVPLKKSRGFYGIDAEPGQTITFGLEWGGMDEATRRRIREMLEMGLDPSGIRFSPLRTVWIKIKLAEEKEQGENE